jgi:branched-chain amino acid transport system ATP-binding protein
VTALLEARGVTMRFGGVVAVNDVSLSIRPHELRCLIGPNGAGKSTFFKMLSGQLRPSAGEILLHGQNIAGRPAEAIAKAGMSIKTQVPNVFNEMTVHENIYLALRRFFPAPLARQKTLAALERFRVAHLHARILNELAHGQRQLVELAMVAAREPSLILLDEPAAGMTEEETYRLGDLLNDLATRSAVVVVEHDMHFIRRIARLVTVFNAGAVLAEGPADEVLADQRVKDVYLGKEAA